MPSTSTLTWLALAPRRNTEVGAPGPPDCTTFSPASASSTSGRVFSCWSRIWAAVTTETLLPTWSSGVGMRVAVTVTSLTGASCAWATASGAAARAAAASNRRLIRFRTPSDLPCVDGGRWFIRPCLHGTKPHTGRFGQSLFRLSRRRKGNVSRKRGLAPDQWIPMSRS